MLVTKLPLATTLLKIRLNKLLALARSPLAILLGRQDSELTESKIASRSIILLRALPESQVGPKRSAKARFTVKIQQRRTLISRRRVISTRQKALKNLH